MNSNTTDSSDEEMREEYDFTDGIRGKYADRFAKGTNIALLDPDVAAVFPDSSSVNDALRALVKIARQDRRREAESTKDCG